jgi:hypothetical protein
MRLSKKRHKPKLYSNLSRIAEAFVGPCRARQRTLPFADMAAWLPCRPSPKGSARRGRGIAVSFEVMRPSQVSGTRPTSGQSRTNVGVGRAWIATPAGGSACTPRTWGRSSLQLVLSRNVVMIVTWRVVVEARLLGSGAIPTYMAFLIGVRRWSGGHHLPIPIEVASPVRRTSWRPGEETTAVTGASSRVFDQAHGMGAPRRCGWSPRVWCRWVPWIGCAVPRGRRSGGSGVGPV